MIERELENKSQEFYALYEHRLMHLAKTDPTAYEEIYLRYYDHIFNFVRSRVRDHHESEDIVSEAFLTGYKKLQNFTPNTFSPKAWFIGIAKNNILMWRRNKGRHPLGLASFEDDYLEIPSNQDTFDKVVERSDMQIFFYAVSMLPSVQKEVVIYRAYTGLSHIDIAKELGKSEGAIKLIYSRARNNLREILNGKVESSTFSATGI